MPKVQFNYSVEEDLKVRFLEKCHAEDMKPKDGLEQALLKWLDGGEQVTHSPEPESFAPKNKEGSITQPVTFTRVREKTPQELAEERFEKLKKKGRKPLVLEDIEEVENPTPTKEEVKNPNPTWAGVPFPKWADALDMTDEEIGYANRGPQGDLKSWLDNLPDSPPKK